MKISLVKPKTNLTIPYFSTTVQAGFPSPAEDQMESSLDFNEYLVKNPSATFCVRVSGHSMIGAGIYDGDLAVIDRSLTPKSDMIVLAVVNGEMTLKRFAKDRDRVYLKSENPQYPHIYLENDQDLMIWGVVTHVIHSLT